VRKRPRRQRGLHDLKAADGTGRREGEKIEEEKGTAHAAAQAGPIRPEGGGKKASASETSAVRSRDLVAGERKMIVQGGGGLPHHIGRKDSGSFERDRALRIVQWDWR